MIEKEDILALKNRKDMKRYLSVVGQFYNFSPENCLLIKRQNPKATQLLEEKAWEKHFNRRPKSDEEPITLMIPAKEDDELKYREIHCFDIEQTDGQPLYLMRSGERNIPTVLFSAIREICGYSIIRAGADEDELIKYGETGYYNEWKNAIVIKKGLSIDRENIILLRELIRSRDNYSEFETQAITYAAAEKLGLNSNLVSLTSLVSIKDENEMRNTIDTIQAGIYTLFLDLLPVLYSRAARHTDEEDAEYTVPFGIEEVELLNYFFKKPDKEYFLDVLEDLQDNTEELGISKTIDGLRERVMFMDQNEVKRLYQERIGYKLMENMIRNR